MSNDPHSDLMAREAHVLVDLIRPILGGNDPAVIGAALVDLLSTYIAGHHPALRYEQLDLLVTTVRQMVPLDVEDMIQRGKVGEDWRDMTKQ